MAMRHNGFVAFILTHGRPDRVLTYEDKAAIISAAKRRRDSTTEYSRCARP